MDLPVRHTSTLLHRKLLRHLQVGRHDRTLKAMSRSMGFRPARPVPFAKGYTSWGLRLLLLRSLRSRSRIPASAMTEASCRPVANSHKVPAHGLVVSHK